MTAKWALCVMPLRRPTLRITGRRRAKRDGNPKAQLLGGPVHAVVRQLLAKHHEFDSPLRLPSVRAHRIATVTEPELLLRQHTPGHLALPRAARHWYHLPSNHLGGPRVRSTSMPRDSETTLCGVSDCNGEKALSTSTSASLVVPPRTV